EKYAVQFTEDGTPIREEVSVDVDSGTEVFRVPGHNNKEAMDVMNDFVAGLTARRLLSIQKCYVSKLDPTLPTPQKLKIDMELATKQPLTDEKLTTNTTPIVLGFADRSSLPQRILDFCGSLPIYEVEEVSVEEMNATLFNSEGYQGLQGRSRRSVFDKVSCSSGGTHRGGVSFCLDLKEKMKPKSCTFSSSSCYYFIVCTADSYGGHTCSYARHGYYDYCCSWTCDLLDSLG
ncbi:unnamed protein product, partial [Porites lobata]